MLHQLLGIRWHWQNLDEEKGIEVGSGFFHGRAWFNIGKAFGPSARIEWTFLHRARHFGATLTTFGDEEDIGFNLGITYLFGISFHIKIFPYKWDRVIGLGKQRATYGYDTGFSIFGDAIWFKWWRDDVGQGWSNKDSLWKRKEFNFNPADFFLGHEKHSSRDINKTPVVVSMPEKNYEGSVRLFESTWKRPRWLFSRRIIRTELELKEGIPHPGKGENSWDCGEDCTYGMTAPCNTVYEAIAQMVESVMRNRQRYGGSVNWKPSGKVYVNPSFGVDRSKIAPVLSSQGQ